MFMKYSKVSKPLMLSDSRLINRYLYAISVFSMVAEKVRERKVQYSAQRTMSPAYFAQRTLLFSKCFPFPSFHSASGACPLALVFLSSPSSLVSHVSLPSQAYHAHASPLFHIYHARVIPLSPASPSCILPPVSLVDLLVPPVSIDFPAVRVPRIHCPHAKVP